MFFFCFCVAFAYLYTKTSFSSFEVVLLSAGGAAGATVADGVSFKIRGLFLDDNLTIPLVSGLVITGIAVITATTA
jgi:dolichol kinase